MLVDAHNHLQDSRLDAHRNMIIDELASIPVNAAVVNGTSEYDWPKVQKLSKEHPWIIPAYGSHPWYLKDRSTRWQNTLKDYLIAEPEALIGEIGLDKWVKDYNLKEQISVFETELELAIELRRPVTIHCLRAFGTLKDILKSYKPLPMPFLLHSYSGPTEMVNEFSDLGAYFSLSGYFALPEKSHKLEAFKAVSLDRLLIETDAPDMLPPENLQISPIQNAEGKLLNCPTNIRSIYEWAANFCETDYDLFTTRIHRNFLNFIGRDSL